MKIAADAAQRDKIPDSLIPDKLIASLQTFFSNAHSTREFDNAGKREEGITCNASGPENVSNMNIT